MHIFRLTSKFIIRRKFKSSISIAVSLILALFITIYAHSLNRQLETMNEFHENIDVTATMTTYDGSSIENLYVTENIIKALEESGFIKEKFYTSKLIVVTDKIPNTYDHIKHPGLRDYLMRLDSIYDSPPTIIGTNSFSTITEFAPIIYESAVFLEGYDEKIFEIAENVAMVNEVFLEEMELDLGDEIPLRVTVPSKDYEEEIDNEVDINLKIVAKHRTHYENAPIYIPWETMEQIYHDLEAQLEWDSARYILQNTKDLDQFKSILSRMGFNYPGRDELNRGMPGMFINDRILITAIGSVTNTVDFMRTLYPIIYFLCGGIGFLVSYLLIRIRKPEYAIMRSIGTSKGKTFMSFLQEQVLLSTIGVTLSIVLTLIISGNITTIQLYSVLGYISFYWVGTSIAIVMMNSGNVIQILTARE